MEALWQASEKRINQATMTDFKAKIQKKFDLSLTSYQDFHRWSVDNPEDFWSEIITYFDLNISGSMEPACRDLGFATYGWFPDIKLNFAENLLRYRDSDGIALSFLHESGLKKEISYRELAEITGRLRESLKNDIGPGDVVACYMPNCMETVITMLATVSLGGIFTSTSCDFGVEGVIDRFSQSRPKILISVSEYQYNGKSINLIPRLETINEKLSNLEKTVVVDLFDKGVELSFSGAVSWSDYLNEQGVLDFVQVPFSTPLYIMYSSGTTGKPKCIVHSHGGTLLQHVKELGLHSDLTQEKSIFYFTTCGWMMWNWLVSSLYFGSRVVLYEGSPSYPSLKEFFFLAEREKINIFGTSPKFLKALEDSGYDNDFKLEYLETMLSTGAPLLPEQFDFVYRKIKKDICLGSIAGGTDIIGCFMLGNPTLPVYRGEIQCLGLGMNVACYDQEGTELIGQQGELVCKTSFPSRPIYFLDDENNEKIKKAYFNRFVDVWHHGDYITITERGGVIVHGRSDATLNPGGVRIGTAEIYRQTERIPWIEDSICVGYQRNGDVEVTLLVKTEEELTEERMKEIKNTIRQGCTPRHIPAHIFLVAEIPYTRSGKKMEVLVTKIINGYAVTSTEAVANPLSIEAVKKINFPS